MQIACWTCRCSVRLETGNGWGKIRILYAVLETCGGEGIPRNPRCAGPHLTMAFPHFLSFSLSSKPTVCVCVSSFVTGPSIAVTTWACGSRGSFLGGRSPCRHAWRFLCARFPLNALPGRAAWAGTRHAQSVLSSLPGTRVTGAGQEARWRLLQWARLACT